MKGCCHFPGDRGSHRQAELFTQGSPHCRGHLDHHSLFRVSQRPPHRCKAVCLLQGSGGADHSTLAAHGAGCGVKRQPHGRAYHRIKSAVLGLDRSHLLNLGTHSDTPPAENAFAGIPCDGRGNIHHGLGHGSLKPALADSQLIAQLLKLTVSIPAAVETILWMIGQQQLIQYLSGSQHLGRMGSYDHSLPYLSHAGGLKVLHSLHFHNTDTAGAVLMDILHMAQTGNPDSHCLSRFHNGGAL